MAASAGALSAWYGGYLDPEVGFTLHVTIESQIAPILGGMYSVAGAVTGAIVIQAISELTRIGFGAEEGVSQLVFGVVLVVGILFMPQGLFSLWQRLQPRQNVGDQPGSSDGVKDAPS
jgi:branched-chain amino acid transport system permease protein